MFVGLPFQEENTIGIANGQGPQQDHINEAENRRVRSDAQRQSQDSDRRETGRFAPHAETKAQILKKVLNPVYSAGVTALLFGLLDTVQINSRAAVRLFLRHSFRDVFLGFSVEVIAQLVVQFLVCLRPAKQQPQPQGDREQPMLRSHVRLTSTRTSARPWDRRAKLGATG